MGSTNASGSPPGRADFNSRVRKILARRAAYRCSNPDCSALTIGPGAGSDEVSETGVAAHIYAASPSGPRGTGGLTFAKRQAHDNGVWLCHRCARLVDNNQGNAFPAALLRSWRDLHEARTRIEQGGNSRPFGWIQRIEVDDDRWTAGLQCMHMSRCNFIIGGIGAGKSCLLSLLVGLSHPHELMSRVAVHHNISAQIVWFDPQPREACLRVSNGDLSYQVDGKRTPFAVRPYRAIVVSAPYRMGEGSLVDLADMLKVDPWSVTAALPRLGSRLGGRVSEARHEDGAVFVRMWNSDRLIRWERDLSSEERDCFFYELAIAIADLQAEVEPTLLLFDSVLSGTTADVGRHLLQIMSAPARAFQTVVLEDNRALAYATNDDLDGWSLTVIDRKDEGSKLREFGMARQVQ